METIVYIVGIIAIAGASIVMLTGLNALLGELLFRARWKWGDAHQLKRSVNLGWNTGMPPEDKLFLVMEYIKDIDRNPQFLAHHEWAVMKRVGDTAYTMNGGMTCPVTNITGWLEVNDDGIKPEEDS